MNKLSFIFILFLMNFYSLPLVNSNFVCGIVEDSEGVSSSWRDVLIYPEDYLDKGVICRSNPENKFCCDIENVSAGDKVFAEVFDEKSGFISKRESLIITGEGYDLFPTMNMKEAILINSPQDRIFINQSQIIVNLSLAENYNNLNYSINSSDYFFKEHFCDDCKNILLPLNLKKGENEIIFTVYGEREISKKIVVYNLDYLQFDLNLFCNKCKDLGSYFYVPSAENIIFSSSFNSSHNISGEFLFYFPSEWKSFNSSVEEDFSVTHNILVEKIEGKKELALNYSFTSPKVFVKTDYFFNQSLENKNIQTRVRVFRLKITPFHKSKPFDSSYFTSLLVQRASPSEPVILSSEENYLETVAIFPKLEIDKSYSNLKFETKETRRKAEYLFTILTSIQNSKIEKIFLVFKVENGKNILLYDANKKVSLEHYKDTQDYTYYSAWVYNKGPFTVILS